MTPEEKNNVRDLRRIVMELKSFCDEQKTTDGCCGDWDRECPIQMGEYWGAWEDEVLTRTNAMLGIAK